MNLLFVSSTFPDAAHPSRGTYNGELCCALAEQHCVQAIAPRPWPEVIHSIRGRQRFVATPDCVRVGIDCRYPTCFYTPKILRGQYGRWMWYSIRDDVIRLNRRQLIDGVLSYWAHPDGEAGWRASRLLDVPHAVIVGGSDVLLLPQQSGRRRNVVNVLQNSQAVVTVSDGLRQAVIELGVPPDRVHTIYQGVDPDVFYPGHRSEARTRLELTSRSDQLLWVGRMVDVKGLNILIEACVELQLRNVDFELSLVGDGPLRAETERLVESKRLRKRVRFAGAVGHDRLADWYRAADVTVNSSWSEGLPNVLRESLACGTPFVSTDVGSIREIADADYSLLVEPGDPGGLADAVVDVLGGHYQQAATCYVARTWSKCAHDMAQLFSELRNAPVHDNERQPSAGDRPSVRGDLNTAQQPAGVGSVN